MTMFSAGAARTDITTFDADAELMGWAQPTNRARAVASPLHARAFVLRHEATGQRVAIVVAEICFISESVRAGVQERLAEFSDEGWTDENVLLTATHTHSGPGGFSHELAYTITTPGYRPHILKKIVDGIVEAIREAEQKRQPATLRYGNLPVPYTEPVAFNRSPTAWNRNPEADRVDWRNRHLATNREMPVLEFTGINNEPIGCLSWFAVHCTSVHADYRWVSADNKGYAATEMEEWAREKYGVDYVAGFCQAASGDVSPNFRYDKHRGLRVGLFDDDFASARFVGEIQSSHTRKILGHDSTHALEGPLSSALLRVNMEYTNVSPKYANGHTGRRTGHAELGMSFLQGTEEGPGPLNPVKGLNQALHRGRKLRKSLQQALGLSLDGADDAQGGKYTFLETGRGGNGQAFGLFSMGNPEAPDWLDPTVAEARRLYKRNALGNGRPWTQGILPLQLIRIGPVVFAGVPMEASTMAGRRIQRSLLEALRPHGVEQIVIAGYANGYASYLTTWEEYQAQCYEGSSTLFGQWSLGAFQTHFDRVAARLVTPLTERPTDIGPAWPRPTDHELEARMHYELPTSLFR